jgi:uncharacterized MAPEG superfamily protein
LPPRRAGHGGANREEHAVMTQDLTLLIWSAALALVQALVAVAGANTQVGLATLAGNREDMPAITGWAGRAQRAHRNMIENLPLFIALVLTAQVTGHANAMTALGAHLFFWARLLYAIVYIAGVAWVRTVLWVVSVIGLLLIFVQLL